MMNKKMSVRHTLLFWLLLIVSFMLTPHALATVSPKDARIIYELSSLEQQSLNLSRTFIEEGLMTGRQELLTDRSGWRLLHRLEVDLHEHYNPERLKAKTIGTLIKTLDSHHANDIIKIMNTPVWKQAVALERKANSVVSSKNLEKYITGQLQQKIPRQVRSDLIKELLALSGTTSLMMELMIKSSTTTIDLLTPEKEIQLHFEPEIRKLVENMRPKYNELLTHQLLFTYRHMPDNQLRTYVEYYKTPAIANLSQAISKAMKEAFK